MIKAKSSRGFDAKALEAVCMLTREIGMIGIQEIVDIVPRKDGNTLATITTETVDNGRVKMYLILDKNLDIIEAKGFTDGDILVEGLEEMWFASRQRSREIKELLAAG